jgi:transglutaminase-like putative cysteine protease
VQKVGPSVDPGLTPAPPGTSSTRILDDEQTRISASVERYYHYYQRVDNTAGLEDLSQLHFNFEPSYQQLAIHFVRILRNGTSIDALKPSEIQVIQKEEDLDQQLYNGTSAAVIFLNDIRVGDVVEFAYTITGENPVLGGRFTDILYVAGNEPIKEKVLRVLFPSKRNLAVKNDNTDLQPTRQTIGEDTEYLWYSKDVSGVNRDDSTPNWFNPYPRINLSEFQSWSDVVNWALPYYQNSQLNNPELKAKVEEWKKSSESPEQRTVAALRFVQDEIRYLGIELGRYSHQPTAPEKVFTRRIGDCKDKSLLLSSILNAMGIEASPALVNTRVRSALDSWQATPFAFDHVIVQTKMNGKTYWLDPTISYQRGRLDKYYDPPYERGLVLRSGSNSLEKISVPTSDAGSIDIVEQYSSSNSSSAVSLVVTRTYRGMEADEMRYRLSSNSPAELARNHLNFYADHTPSITSEGLPAIDDDQTSNVIVVKERYLISELWKDSRHSFVADRISNELQKPYISQRTTPLAVNYPLSIKQTILIDLNSDFDFPQASDVLTDDALRFEYSYTKNANQLGMTFSLRTFSDSVPVANLQRHLALLDEAQSVIGFDLSRGRRGIAAANPGPPSNLMVAITAMIVFIPIVGLSVLLIRSRTRRRRRTQFVKELQARPGTSPETAFRMSSEQQMESFLRNYSCRCGSQPYDPARPPKPERFMYDGQRLVGFRLQCPSCKLTSDLYINPQFENGSETELADLSTS